MDGLKKAIGEAKLNNYTVTVTESWVIVERKKPEITLDTELSTDKLNPTVVESTSYTLSGKVTDKEGIKSFTINGTEVTVGADGTWSTTLTLTQDEVKEVTMVATNNNKDTTTKVGYVEYVVYNDFTITSSNRSKIGYTDETTELVIPATFYDEENGKWYKVTRVGRSAFNNCTNLTSVTIPNSAYHIEAFAFESCSNLASVIIQNGVQYISSQAFKGCSNLTSVTIPDSVTSIGDAAFMDCSNLTSVTIGSGVTGIGYNAFDDCGKLATINVNSNNSAYCSKDGALYNKDMTTLVRYPEAKPESNYIIPDGVTSFGYMPFYECSKLNSVTIPDSVTIIRERTFFCCRSLNSVIISDSVTRISANAFWGCSSLKSATFENTSGWWVDTSIAATSGETVDITDTITAATYLRSTYVDKYWFRSE